MVMVNRILPRIGNSVSVAGYSGYKYVWRILCQKKSTRKPWRSQPRENDKNSGRNGNQNTVNIALFFDKIVKSTVFRW